MEVAGMASRRTVSLILLFICIQCTISAVDRNSHGELYRDLLSNQQNIPKETESKLPSHRVEDEIYEGPDKSYEEEEEEDDDEEEEVEDVEQYFFDKYIYGRNTGGRGYEDEDEDNDEGTDDIDEDEVDFNRTEYWRMYYDDSSFTDVHNRTKRQSNQECYVATSGGTVAENSACHFPFRYNGKTYYSCTKKNHRVHWCATEHYYHLNKKWGNCKDGCKRRTVVPYVFPTECKNVVVTDGGTAKAGSKCKFPFNVLDLDFYRCTTVINDGVPWCYTNLNTRVYGPCKQTVWTTGGTAPEGSKCVFPFKYNEKWHHGCITQNNKGDPWCSINSKYWPDKEWGYCDFRCDPQAMGPLTPPENCPGLTCSVARVSDNYMCKVMAERKGLIRECRFPFKYEGKEYHGCTGRDNNGRKWCYVKEINEVDKIRWGNCIVPTFGGNADNEPCRFPFKYKGKWRRKCVPADSSGTPMCSVTKYYRDNKWGFCTDPSCPYV